MRRKYERSYRMLKNQMPLVFICSIFLFGIIAGSLYSNSLDGATDQGAAEVSRLIDSFIVRIHSGDIPSSDLFGRSLLSYGKLIVLIWLLGLVPIATPVISLLLGVQGFSYGFTTSFFVMRYNLKGFILCLGAYGVQGTLFVYVIFILSMEAIKLSKKDTGLSYKIYLINLFVGTLCVIIIALYESYITPVIIQYLIGVFF